MVAAISDACGGDTSATTALWERAWAARDGAAPGDPVVPRQLPPDVRAFTGRAAELDQLDALLAMWDNGTSADAGNATVVTVIAGTAGVGKSALAVHWARRVSDRFPDGQLWVNLRGYDPARPVTAEQALTGFLRALGVPGANVPSDLDDLTGLYRSLLSDRRVLVVLDNASSAEQVRPLLPGGTGCLVIVTSRDDLAGLVARDGATRLRLDLFTPDESVALLRTLLRPAIAEPEVTAVERLAELCARLPLALRIAADRVASQAERGIDGVVAELAAASPLDSLATGGDPYTAVRTVFSWSYRALGSDAAAMFRMLGLVPGADWDAHVAAALTARPLDEAKRLLDALSTAHLIERRRADRFQMHDLLRAYAIESVESGEPEPARRAAVTRLLDYYLATAASAMDIAFPHESHRRPRVTVDEATPVPPLRTAGEALAWLDRECGNVIAAATHAAQHGRPAHTAALAATMHGYLYIVSRPGDALTMHGHALAAVRAMGDRAAEVVVLNNLSSSCASLDRHAEAIAHAELALSLARELADQAGEANALVSLGKTYWMDGCYPDALAAYQQALAKFRRCGDQAGELATLNNIGDTYLEQGDYPQAAKHYRQAIALCPVIGDRRGEATALANLGLVFERWGRYDDAFQNLQLALTISREIGQRLREAHTLDDLSRIYLHWREFDHAAAHARQALAIFGEVGSNTNGLICTLDDLAQIYWASDQNDKAIEHARRAVGLGRQSGRRQLESISLNGLGEIERAAEHPEDSLAHHERALELARDVGQRFEEARALDGIAHARYLLGDHAGAGRYWELAQASYAELGLPQAAAIGATLDRLRSVG